MSIPFECAIATWPFEAERIMACFIMLKEVKLMGKLVSFFFSVETIIRLELLITKIKSSNLHRLV